MDSSSAVVASGSVFVLVSSCGLLLFGKGKNSKDQPTDENAITEASMKAAASFDDKGSITEQAGNYGPSKKRLIPLERLENSKKQLRTALLEKELASAALTRLFEAEAKGEITRDEREVLGQKYREELKNLNYKISQIDAFIEVGDLETLREQLLQLVREKIDAIEKRIERTQKAAEPLIKEILSRDSKPATVLVQEQRSREKPQVPDISDLLAAKTPTAAESQSPASSDSNMNSPKVEDFEKPVVAETLEPVEKPTAVQKRRSQESDGQVEELQKELLEALDRLEKLDVES